MTNSIGVLVAKLAAMPALPTQVEPAEPSKKKRKNLPSFPTLGAGLGLGSAAAYGLHRSLASDEQVAAVNKAISNYKPEAFTTGQYPPNQTGLTYYQNTLSPAAQLTPLGVPVSSILPAIRSSEHLMGKKPIVDFEQLQKKTFAGVPYGKWVTEALQKQPGVADFLQKGLNTPSYHMESAADRAGISGLAHYGSFAKGPIPAYAHQMKAKLRHVDVPAELGAAPGTKYTDWMGRKLEDFLQGQPGTVNPFEVTPELFSNEQQSKIMEEFHKTLSPEEQAFRLKVEDPGAGYADQVSNYMGPAKGILALRDKLKTVGITGGGAAAGALGGHYLYNVLNKDKKKSKLMRGLASTAGAGLGGGAAYLVGTDSGRKLLSKLLPSKAASAGTHIGRLAANLGARQ